MAKGHEGRSGHDDNVLVWMGMTILMIRKKCSGSRPFQSKDWLMGSRRSQSEECHRLEMILSIWAAKAGLHVLFGLDGDWLTAVRDCMGKGRRHIKRVVRNSISRSSSISNLESSPDYLSRHWLSIQGSLFSRVSPIEFELCGSGQTIIEESGPWKKNPIWRWRRLASDSHLVSWRRCMLSFSGFY